LPSTSVAEVFEHGVIENLLRQPALEFCVLVLKRLEPPFARNFQPSVLGLPFEESRRADIIFPAGIGGRDSAIKLHQDRDDLLFT